MKFIDFVPVTGSVIVVGVLAALAKSAIQPIALYAICGLICIVLAKLLGLKYVGSLSDVTRLRPSVINLHLCASLLASAFVLAITLGGENVRP
jgi:hypothetical protein